MRTWLFLCVVAVSVALPPFVQAESSCNCFCGTPREGAAPLSGGYEDSSACIEACRDAGVEPVGCFTREDEYPENSEICWTQTQCEGGTQKGLGNVWFNDAYDCDDRHGKMGYCYAGPRSITTIIAISGDNTFSGLAEYIDAIYRWLVPVMAIVAVVMVMIAGLQYILSHGNPSAVKKAKERIAAAVVGLVLLLSAYTLARFLDPRLVEFEQLRIPKVKEVVTLSEGTMCETLALAGIEIDSVEPAAFVDKTCSFAEGGVQGVVTDVADVKDNVDIGQWTEGDKCNYSKCDPGATCMSTGCVSCADVKGVAVSAVTVDTTSSGGSDVNTLSDLGTELSATASTCALMSEEGGGTGTDKQYCIYTTGGYSVPLPISRYPSACVNVPIECAALQSTATEWKKDGKDVCGIYGDLEQKQVFAATVTEPAVNWIVSGTDMDWYAQIDPTVYKTVCNDDPCGLGALQGKTCAFTSSTLTCGGK